MALNETALFLLWSRKRIIFFFLWLGMFPVPWHLSLFFLSPSAEQTCLIKCGLAVPSWLSFFSFFFFLNVSVLRWKIFQLINYCRTVVLMRPGKRNQREIFHVLCACAFERGNAFASQVQMQNLLLSEVLYARFIYQWSLFCVLIACPA